MNFKLSLCYDGLVKLLKVLGLVIILFLLIKPSFANAKINVRIEPDPPRQGDNLKFIFTSDLDNTFDPNNDSYRFFIVKDARGMAVKPTNDKLLEVSTVALREGASHFTLKVGGVLLGSAEIIGQDTVFEGEYTVLAPLDKPRLAMDHSAFQSRTTQNLYILNAVPNLEYRIWFDGNLAYLFSGKFNQDQIKSTSYSSQTAVASINMGPPSPVQKTICLSESQFFFGASTGLLRCEMKLLVDVKGTPPDNPGGPIQSQEPEYSPPTIVEKFAIPPPPCDVRGQKCETALGTISTNPADFVKSIFGIVLSIAGGVALILIMISGYSLMFSQGNQEKVQAAREQLTSAIVGLLFIIFSITILQIIGVDILRIPGLSR